MVGSIVGSHPGGTAGCWGGGTKPTLLQALCRQTLHETRSKGHKTLYRKNSQAAPSLLRSRPCIWGARQAGSAISALQPTAPSSLALNPPGSGHPQALRAANSSTSPPSQGEARSFVPGESSRGRSRRRWQGSPRAGLGPRSSAASPGHPAVPAQPGQPRGGALRRLPFIAERRRPGSHPPPRPPPPAARPPQGRPLPPPPSPAAP